MLDVYVYGSGECDQLGVPDFDDGETKVPIKVTLNTEPSNKVYKIACGGMHTLVLSTVGKIFSWGCNDDGALGRVGKDNEPGLIEAITFPITNIVAGDSHSVAYNTELNLIYRWGSYRDNAGKLGDPILVPELMKKKDFDNLTIKKAVCGANHVLVLAGKSLFAWGNKESGQTGISSKTNIKYSYLFPHRFSTKNVEDIFTGLNHSFLVTKGKSKELVLKGWGLNKHYQLGLGDSENYHIPVKLYWFSDEKIKIKNVTGGDFHSIFLSEDNEIYVCGRNDEGQCGVESKIIHENNEKYLNRYKIESNTNNNQNVDLNEIRDDLTKINENVEGEEGDFIKYPLKINFFDKATRSVDQILSSMNFNYSIDTKNNQAYSWGLGYSYVLGNKKDNNERLPFTIPKTFFKDMKIDQISLGCQHVAVSLTDSSNLLRPTLEVDMEKYREELRSQADQKKTKTGKRRNALTDLNIQILEQNQEDLNAPRGMRPRRVVVVKEVQKSASKSTKAKETKPKAKAKDKTKTSK